MRLASSRAASWVLRVTLPNGVFRPQHSFIEPPARSSWLDRSIIVSALVTCVREFDVRTRILHSTSLTAQGSAGRATILVCLGIPHELAAGKRIVFTYGHFPNWDMSRDLFLPDHPGWIQSTGIPFGRSCAVSLSDKLGKLGKSRRKAVWTGLDNDLQPG